MLKDSYFQNRPENLKAGYYLLWLIKLASGANFQIPSQSSFTITTVSEVLAQFINSGPCEMVCVTNFITLLFFKPEFPFLDGVPILQHHLYSHLLDLEWSSKFLVNDRHLASISMDRWPNGIRFIMDLFVEHRSSSVIAELLASSKDLPTAKFGEHLQGALLSTSLTEAIPRFHALCELRQDLNSAFFVKFFDMPFPPFRKVMFYKSADPEFSRRLPFNLLRNKVFVQGELIIGVYDPQEIRGYGRMLPYLLAYNMKTEKMVWGFPIRPNPFHETSKKHSFDQLPFHVFRIGDDLALSFRGDKIINRINLETGEVSELELPHIFGVRTERNPLHLTPRGHGFLEYRDGSQFKLIGGKIVGPDWKTTFEVNAPLAEIIVPLSTHVGFLQTSEDKLVVFNSSGHQTTIFNCLSAKTVGDKLYLIEQCPLQGVCALTVRTLTECDRVVTDVERSIVLKTKGARLGALCENGEWVLFSGDVYPHGYPIFVDLRSGEVVYTEHKGNTQWKQAINTATGVVWRWNDHTKQIWSISSEGVTMEGEMTPGNDTSLLHVDSDNNLYFADFPSELVSQLGT